MTNLLSPAIFDQLAKIDNPLPMNFTTPPSPNINIESSNIEIVEVLVEVLEAIEYPAFLVNARYEILGYNRPYTEAFGNIDLKNSTPTCFQVSHGYTVPCDQAGEDCPIKKIQQSDRKERVLHIHQTKNGSEHIEIESFPIHDSARNQIYFLEVMKPIALASGGNVKQNMVGSSPPFIRMLDRIAKVGRTDAAVLLLGESGTGKELAARAIHKSSNRKNKSLITLECSGLTDSLFESELFGHIKGAFTGANTNKKGLVELAHGGTLFLDEIADVPPSMQVKLLRLLENQTFRPVGSTEIKRSDFRLICATHKNIKKMVEEEKFRLDLFHRINIFPIQLPSLHERIEDLPAIAKTLLKQIDPDKEFFLTDSALKIIFAQPLKGNIRELRNILNRATVLAETNVIDKTLIAECIDIDITETQFHHHNINTTPVDVEETSPWVDLKTHEKNYIAQLNNAYHGDIKKMAETLNISIRSLYRKLQEIKNT